MRQIRELLHLHFEQGLSQRLIARSLGVVRSTVERVIKRFTVTGLTWPPPRQRTGHQPAAIKLWHGQFQELCPVPSLVPGVYDVLQTITTSELRRFVSDVLTLTPVFHGFWTATAGTKHHAWTGGLAWHSLEVARDVADVMSSSAPKRVRVRHAAIRLAAHRRLRQDILRWIDLI